MTVYMEDVIITQNDMGNVYAKKILILIRTILIVFICIEYEDGTESQPPTTTKSNLLRYVSSRHREYYGFFFV